jgi:tRNA1Val (adenine37-N6)-methyltransferase
VIHLKFFPFLPAQSKKYFFGCCPTINRYTAKPYNFSDKNLLKFGKNFQMLCEKIVPLGMKFYFKEFDVEHDRSTMKVGTDAVLLGCLADLGSAETILEVGCGCGVISLMLAQRFPNTEIHAIDIDEYSVEEAKLNFANSKWYNRLSAECTAIQNFTTSRLYDCVVSNPPFFSNSLPSPLVKKNLAKHINNLDYHQLLECSSKLLKENGKIIVIIPTSEMQIFNTALAENNLYIHHLCNVFFKKKQNPDRVIIKISKERKLERPTVETLQIHNENQYYTEKYLTIVKNFLIFKEIITIHSYKPDGEPKILRVCN